MTEPGEADNITATEGRLGNRPSVYKQQEDTRLDLCTEAFFVDIMPFGGGGCLSPECHRCEEALCETQHQRPACSRRVAISGCCTGHNNSCRKPQLRHRRKEALCATHRTKLFVHNVLAICTGHTYCRPKLIQLRRALPLPNVFRKRKS